MALKRKIRNLPDMNDQMSFFDPVYPNDDIQTSDNENEDDLLADGIPRPTFGKGNKNESNETLDNDTITNNDQDQASELISTSKILIRIKQIQNSIQQARAMLESMEKFKHLVPGTDEQRQKLHSIIANLEEQQASYANLLNLITLTEEERSTINRNSAFDDDDEDLSLRRNVQSPIRPRIESKIGFIPQTTIPTVSHTINSSDNEQTNRNDNSNYDSLVGSLKSDTIYWKDQQSTSDDEASDVESEKNLLLQKEQLRALQGQKRALLAIQRRSEQRLIEQQELVSKKTTNLKQTNEENDLLSDINNLRDRLKLLRNIYEQKHQVEIQQLKNSSKIPSIPTENRLKNLEHIRDRLDELEQIVTYYQTDLTNQPDDAQHLKTLVSQTTNNNNDTPKHLDKLSSELTAKRLELEQAKSALNQLQEMVKTIQPDEYSSSARSTPIEKQSPSQNNDFEFTNTPASSQHAQKSLPIANNSVDAKMVAQHREITRLVESRQRLHTIKDQIASLHQSMTTPPIPPINDLRNETKTYEDKLNDSRNIRPSYRFNYQENASQDDNESELYRFEGESNDGEETDEDSDIHIQINQQTQPRIKQSNLCASDTIVGKHSDELNTQMREICRCLSTFIDEQKSFNRHIEQRLSTATNPSLSQPTDPMFNQLQQQVLTQGLIVNLNTAYREIAVLQSEINALQSENTRLTSSISFDNQYHHHHIPHLYSRDNSKESIYSIDQIKPTVRPQPRSRFNEQLKQQNQLLTTNQFFENSSKTSFNSQSTGKQTAIHVDKINMETTPNKQERNAKFSTEYLSSPKQISNTYDLPNHHRHSSKENLSKSFVIRRRPITTDNTNNQLYNYKQHRLDDSDDEQQSNDFSTTVFNIQPSVYSTSTTQDLDNVDIQTIDLQLKSIMVQLIPFMRLRINEIFNQSILNHIRERVLFLFKQQPDSAQLIRHFQNQFSELLGKTIEKYCGTAIRECAGDLIRDISDFAFDELVKYKIYENANNLQKTQSLIKQQDEYSHVYKPSTGYYTQETSVFDDGENDNKYQIELSESENRPLTLIGSDEEDNDADQEENKVSELETAVSRQESNLHQNESPISTEFHSNGHEYVLVNRSASYNIEPKNEEENDNS